MTERNPISTPALPGGLPFDASQIQFTPAGAGAVPRSVQSKEREVVSAFDFMTAAQIADVLAGTALLDVGAAITTAIASITTGTLYFPTGTYAYATSPNFAKANVSIVCGQLTIFKHTGTGNAFTLDAGANPAFINGINLENAYILGNINSTHGLFGRGIGRLILRNIISTGCSPTGSNFEFQFVLAAYLCNCKTSLPGPSALYGIHFTRRNAGENSTDISMDNPCIESVTTAGGAGLFIEWATAINSTGGTAEGCDTGVRFSPNSPGDHHIDAMDIEGNAVLAIDLQCPKTTLSCPSLSGTVAISGASAVGNTILGGEIGILTTDASSANNNFVGLTITTSLTDNSPSSNFIACRNSATGQMLNGIGGGVLTSAQYQLAGTFTTALTNVFGYLINGTLVPAANGEADGLYVAATLNKAGSGTHTNFNGVRLDAPVIGAGAAALTNATTLHITGAPATGTNKRALWVEAGNTDLGTGTITSNGSVGLTQGSTTTVGKSITVVNGLITAFA